MEKRVLGGLSSVHDKEPLLGYQQTFLSPGASSPMPTKDPSEMIQIQVMPVGHLAEDLQKAVHLVWAGGRFHQAPSRVLRWAQRNQGLAPVGRPCYKEKLSMMLRQPRQHL